VATRLWKVGVREHKALGRPNYPPYIERYGAAYTQAAGAAKLRDRQRYRRGEGRNIALKLAELGTR
jgi:hypothetical protein